MAEADVLIFWKLGNFIAEMQGRHALKQFVRKGVMSFSRILHTRCLMSLSFPVKKKNCRINFQCRRNNVIMVVYGKSYCGPCPVYAATWRRLCRFDGLGGPMLQATHKGTAICTMYYHLTPPQHPYSHKAEVHIDKFHIDYIAETKRFYRCIH